MAAHSRLLDGILDVSRLDAGAVQPAWRDIDLGALLAARHDHELVSMADIEAAKDKVIMGAERRGQILGDPLLKMDGQAVFKLAVGVLEDRKSVV